jgi:putative acetyltransferase
VIRESLKPIVRSEQKEDLPAIQAVNVAAFGRCDEADLVEALRAEGAVLLSLVAEVESRIAGHILFSRMWIDYGQDARPAAALAPVAVLPDFQNRGIGAALVQRGLELLKSNGEGIVLVLGHPAYYQRFGFSVEKAKPVQTPFPPDAFLALELSPGALPCIAGKARYARSFGL